MRYYFGNVISTVSTVMILLSIACIVYAVTMRNMIQHWGRRTALLGLWGLVICCFVAMRDGYDKSVQAYFDPTLTAGLFSLGSIQSTLCCIGGAIIAFACFSSIFIKNQKYRKMMFFTLSLTMVVKMLVIEISRWGVLL